MLFADDILLSLTAPHQSLPELQKELSKFEEVGGFRVNMDKSYILNVTMSAAEAHSLKSHTTLRWAEHSLQYLGVFLTSSITGLYKANFPPTLLQLQSDLTRWAPLFISWLGRIHAIKMTLLPKLLYLFQALPIPLESSFFVKVKSLFTKFIWQKGRARLSFSILRRPRSKGGVGLPDVELYYKAAQLRILTEWFRRDSKKQWFHMDKAIAGGTL